METPKGCEEHQDKYKQNACELYTVQELGSWVHLLTKRAEHRTNFAKKDKDLTDASNYLAMMQSKLTEMKTVNIEDFAQAIVKRLAEECDSESLVKAVRVEKGNGDWEWCQEFEHELATVSWIKEDGAPYMGFAQTWSNFIEPTIIAMVEGLEGVKEIYELGGRDKPLPLGCRTLVTTFENMSVRFATSYHAGKGTRTTIDVGVPKEEDLKEKFPEKAVKHIKKLGMVDFRSLYEEDPESLGFPKRDS